MKGKVKGAFKSYIFCQKNPTENQVQALHESFLNPPRTEVPISPISKSKPSFSVPSSFWRIFRLSGQDKQNGEKAYCRLPP